MLKTPMFERYTEKSRRVIFFARYEASNYGSQYIESEHLLLGIIQERREKLKVWFPGQKNVESQIRDEIERRITRGERIPTSVEIPLTVECQKILQLAADAAAKLRHQFVEPEHLLIAILQEESCLAAQILSARELKVSRVEKRIEQESRLGTSPISRAKGDLDAADSGAQWLLNEFLEGLKSLRAGDLLRLFAKDAQFIDASGKLWTRDEIESHAEVVFAGYAKKNATFAVQGALVETNEIFVATVLWKNAILASQERAWTHRMTVVLQFLPSDCKIVLVQITPVQASSSFSASK